MSHKAEPPALGAGGTADERSTKADSDTYPAQLRRRREASYRLPPLDCGCRDPWPCRCRPRRRTSRPVPFVMLSVALSTLRRAWFLADEGDRIVLADIAAVLTDLAEPAELLHRHGGAA
jgi:hypothetical protein